MTAYRLLLDCEYYLRRHLQQAPSDEPIITTTGNGILTGQNNSDNSNSSSNGADDGSTSSGGNGLSQSRGRTVLTVLYLCVLSLCFIVPAFYYFRIRCFEATARREMELDFTTALEQSTNQQHQHRDELRASRRKYIEERRARIVQLFGPVRMILTEEHFPHLNSDDNNRKTIEQPQDEDDDIEMAMMMMRGKNGDESVTIASEGDVLSPFTSDDDDDDNFSEVDTGATHDSSSNNNNNNKNSENEQEQDVDQMEQGLHYRSEDDDVNYEQDQQEEQGNHALKTTISPTEEPILPPGGGGGDDDNVLVRLPKPGLQHLGSASLFVDPTKPLDDMQDREMRLCQGLCSICLSNYKVGSDVVWSSNEACDHHFHAACIEKWLMKQREGPLCPCCRRDFIVDPFDLLEEENNNNNEGGDNGPVLFLDPAALEDDSGLNFELVNVPEPIREDDDDSQGNEQGRSNIQDAASMAEEGRESSPETANYHNDDQSRGGVSINAPDTRADRAPEV